LSRVRGEHWVLILCRWLRHVCAGVCIWCLLGIDIGRWRQDWVWTGDGTLSEIGVLDVLKQRLVADLFLSVGRLLIDLSVLNDVLCCLWILSKLASILNRIPDVLSHLFADGATTAKDFIQLITVRTTVATESTCACVSARVSALSWSALLADGCGDDRRWVGAGLIGHVQLAL
jgi:hypothetical protein